MDELGRAYQWLEEGKQIGKSFTYTKEGKEYYSSVGVQKWNDIYKFYFSEIEESQMAAYEDYLIEEIIEVSNLEELQNLLSQKALMHLEDLRPQKGQKIFNPNFS